jgi:hypothetical protein
MFTEQCAFRRFIIFNSHRVFIFREFQRLDQKVKKLIVVDKHNEQKIKNVELLQSMLSHKLLNLMRPYSVFFNKIRPVLVNFPLMCSR